MEYNIYTTSNKYYIDVTTNYMKKLIDDAPVTIKRINQSIKDDYHILDNAEFQLLVIQFAITTINDITTLLKVNNDNLSLTINQRELLSDIYRVACDKQPIIPISLRIEMINEDIESFVKPSMIPLAIDDSTITGNSGFIGNWYNIFQSLSLLDIVCVIKELFGNRD